MTKYQALFQEFGEALDRLAEVLKQEKTEFMRDSAIKRFEIVFDLSWKVIKACLEEKGVYCASPMSCFKEAYRQGFIEYEEIWLEILKLRNDTVHTYDVELADTVYGKLPNVLDVFKKLKIVLSRD